MIKLNFIECDEKSTKKRVIGNYRTSQECSRVMNDYISNNKLRNVKPYRCYW
uniref:Uncharacterized protein n=1 Tax=Siphoviridae sp. ctgaY24 TaxID=2827911 RepID=A0A8S5SAT5_9CAUD|nr:MAG TPA: hypothetical protein [Siphoviridae sp. ctgaY24]